MRLSLKAQAQCRVTVEALAEIKNPRPVAFVKQANISNGPQQVNNGAPSETSHNHAGAPARETQIEPSKLLEATDVERLDTGAPSTAGAAHQEVETVGVLNRPEERGR